MYNYFSLTVVGFKASLHCFDGFWYMWLSEQKLAMFAHITVFWEILFIELSLELKAARNQANLPASLDEDGMYWLSFKSDIDHQSLIMSIH